VLFRSVRAPRDPAWTADGIVSDEWEPVSPVTGRLDAFEWKVPVASNARPAPLAPGNLTAPPALPPAEAPLPLASAENAQ
jgi:HemY protein